MLYNTKLLACARYRLVPRACQAYRAQTNSMVGRVIRTCTEQWAHRHRFEALQHAGHVVSGWIGFYNTWRLHQALGMKTPAEAFASAA